MSNLSRREALETLNVDGISKRGVRMSHMLLSRNYHLDKFSERCDVSRVESEKKLKKSNAHAKLRI